MVDVLLQDKLKNKKKHIDESYSNQDDVYKVRREVVTSITPQHWILGFGARIINYFLILIGISPFVLFFVLPTLAFFNIANPITSLFAALLWVWAFFFFLLQLRLFYTPAKPMKANEQQELRCSKVVVVGAGPVGLAAVKECLEMGLQVECFDSKAGLGGVFRYDENHRGGVWKSARLTSSPWVTAFSDFPPSSESSVQYSHEEYIDYLESYANRFDLMENIHFRHTVVKVEPAESGWNVMVRNEETADVRTVQCARVVICSGLHQNPKQMCIPGKDSFNGDIRHVVDYKEPKGYEGKTVVVAGLGESGADIAYELSSVAKKTLLSIYRGKFIIPRINPLTGKASDYDTNRVRNAVPLYLKDWFMSFKRRLCSYMQHHTEESAVRNKLLQLSATGANSQTATKSDDFIKPLLTGCLRLTQQIVRFDQNEVVFADGNREVVDIVLFAHGYQPAFPYLQLPDNIKKRHPSKLYLHMFHPDMGDKIAFLGFARPALGAIPPIGEMQARLFALVAAEQRVLPSKTDMLKYIEIDFQKNKARFPKMSEQHSTVAWIPYLDKLATLIGCQPDPRKLITKPRLMWKIATGPVNGAHYRLHGTGAKPIASDTILSLPRGHGLDELLIIFGLHFWSWPLQLIKNSMRYRSDGPYV